MPANPIRTPSYYKTVEIGGRVTPGELIAIRNLKSTEEWTTVRPIAGTGYTQTHKGRVPVKGIEVEVCLNARDDAGVAAAWTAHYAFVKHVRGKAPPLISRPRAMVVNNTSFIDVGVRSVVYAGHQAGIFTIGKNTVVYVFDEATKSTLAPVGPPEPAVLNETNPNPTTLQGAALVDIVQTTRGPQDPREPLVTVSDLGAQYGTGL